MSCTCNFGTGLSVCHCARCHQTFTSVTAFDMHQSVGDDGLHCSIASLMVKRDGSPKLAIYRNTPDGRPVWGQFTLQPRQFDSRAEISGPNSPAADDGEQGMAA